MVTPLASALICAASMTTQVSGRTLPAIETVWRVTETPGFVIYGDVDERTLYQVTFRLATLRAVLARTAGGLSMGTERPIPVFAFSSDASFAPYLPSRQGTARVAGYFSVAHGYRAIALNIAAEDEAYSGVYHELVHHLVRRNFGEVPLWFNEGIAVLYESFRRNKENVVIGMVPLGRLRWLDSRPLMPVARLTAVRPGDDEYHEAERAGTFYVQSSLLVHDLLFGNPVRGKQLSRYLELVAEGTPQSEALESSFDGGAAGLDTELAVYLKNGYYPYVEVAIDDLHIPPPQPVRRLGRVEALDALGFLAFAAVPGEPDFARRHFEAARELAPEDALSDAGIGAVAFARRRYDEALVHIDAAVTLGADDPALLVLGARAILRQEPRRDGPASAGVSKARRWLESAIKADPFDDDALVAYGRSFLSASGDGGSGVRAFERADRIERLDGPALVDLLALYVRGRDRAKAEALFETRVRGRVPPDIVREAFDTLLRLDYNDATDAFDAKDFSRALALAQGVRDRVSAEELRSGAAALILKLEAAMADPPAENPTATAAPKP
jgi:hypothetical protein